MRLALRIAAAVALLAAAALVVLAASTFPPRSGSAVVAGISSPVEIAEDAHGVARIRARSQEDAAAALGWLHARDRLWQLEYQRRVAAGRLSEVFGESTIEADRFLRTLGLHRAAEARLAGLDADLRRTFDAYVAGINAFLAHEGARPLELRLLRLEPEPFTAADALSSGLLIAWDLAADPALEIRRARLEALLGKPVAASLFPPAPVAPTILSDGEWTMPAPAPPAPPAAARPSKSARARAAVPTMRAPIWARLQTRLERAGAGPFDREARGSNSWVVSGARTTTGLPILANDPHLTLRAPSTWYLASLEAPGLQVSGATLPGLPIVIIGRNAHLAWGLTSLSPDDADLFVETLAAGDATRYRHRGEWKSFSSRREVLRVRGGRQVSFDVRESVHGPILGDVLEGSDALGPAVALRWTGVDPDDRSLEALFRVNRARDGAEMLAAVALHGVPAQNFLWATAKGQIGYAASGRIPIRPRHDGATPVSGEGEDDWLGYVDRDAMPRAIDPPRGWIVTANNRVVSEAYPFPFTSDWPEPYRSRRISDRLVATPRLSPEDVRAIQMDVVSYQAMDLLPILRGTVPADPLSAQALRLLDGWWELDFRDDSVRAAIYAAWYTEISKIAEDEAGPAGRPARSRFLLEAFTTESKLCDDVRSPAKESCAAFSTRALAAAVEGLARRLGKNPERWVWGRLHHVRFAHAFEGLPLLGGLLSPAAPRGGDASTVNVGSYRRDGSFAMREGPSYRQVVALGAEPEMGLVHAPGQSGNVLDRRYRDLMPLWLEGRMLRLDAPVAKRLTLVPGD